MRVDRGTRYLIAFAQLEVDESINYRWSANITRHYLRNNFYYFEEDRWWKPLLYGTPSQLLLIKDSLVLFFAMIQLSKVATAASARNAPFSSTMAHRQNTMTDDSYIYSTIKMIAGNNN